MRRRLLALLFVLGCSHGVRPAPAIEGRADLVAEARARAIPDQLIGRFSLSVDSELPSSNRPVPIRTKFTTGGALVVDRPERGHLAVLSPLGAPVATLQTDGEGLAIAISRGRRHFLAPDAEVVLREVSRDLVGLDDLFGLLVGDPPLDGVPERSRRTLEDGAVEVVLAGPTGGEVLLTFEPGGATLRAVVVRDEKGAVQLSAAYGPYQPLPDSTTLAPSDLVLDLPPLGATVEIRMKSWTVPTELPDVFGLAPPEGFTSEPMARVLGALALGSAIDGPGPDPGED